MKGLRSLKAFVQAACLLAAIWACGCAGGPAPATGDRPGGLEFIVTSDILALAGPALRPDDHFAAACAAIREGGRGAFMVSPGDVNPPWDIADIIHGTLGADYAWYPAVGNHDAEEPRFMAWLRDWGRGLPHIVRRGPPGCAETTYAFDAGDAHFVVLNQYFDGVSDTGADGDVVPALLDWLGEDLAANRLPFVFVLGHEPLVSIPDVESGRVRHEGDSLDAHPESRLRFLQLLRAHRVTAYICGHTHDFSHARINGVWQIDAGHCRGTGDTGARSTFLRVRVAGGSCRVEAYRLNPAGKYEPADAVTLN